MRTSQRTTAPRSGAPRRLAAAALALVVVLAGCSDTTPSQDVRAGSGGGTSSGAGSSKAGDASSATPVDGATTLPLPDGAGSNGDGGTAGATEPGQPGQVDPSPPVKGGSPAPPPGGAFPPPSAGPGAARDPHPWDDYTVGADGRTLTFTYWAGVEPCSVFDSIVAEEGPDSVRVTIYERSGPEGVACIMLALQKSATVSLDSPLGARRLVDGAVTP